MARARCRAHPLRAAAWIAAVLCGATGTAFAADAQPYPSKPIRLIVPFPAGGPVDGMARVLAPRLGSDFKQTVVVDNRPGASGMIAIEAGVRAAPDGYTLVMVSSSYAASAATYRLAYDPVRDVTPIVLLGVAPHLAAVHPSLPVANARELIEHAKANPGKLNYGSSGTGGSVHLATELLNQMAGTRMTHVPYKGQAPALNDLLGGQIHLFAGSPMVVYPQVKAGRLRAIAVTSARRSAAMPDVPAFAETVPGYESLAWQAVIGPKALPADLVARWNGELNRLLELAEMRERLAGDSMEVAGGTPQRFYDQLERDVAKWRKVVQNANIQVGGAPR
jgi:tripartite-type tricarboxylate transporter receptor subunit TctC